MNKLKKIFHRISHIFNNYSGHVWSCTQDDQVWIGFKCSQCGEVNNLHNVDNYIDEVIRKGINE